MSLILDIFANALFLEGILLGLNILNILFGLLSIYTMYLGYYIFESKL